MKLTVLSPNRQLTRLECQRDLTAADPATGTPSLEGWLGPDWESATILLGLAGVSYADSAGIGWLICLHKKCQDVGGLLVLHSLTPMVYHAFRILDLFPLLHVASDEAAALELAGSLARRTS